MAWYRFHNETEMPIHVAISWGGIIQFHKNDIPPGGYWGKSLGIGAHDISGVVSNGSNQFNPDKSNVGAIAEWIIGGAAATAAVVGLVAIPVSGGLTGPISLAAGTAAAATIAGAVTVAADAVIMGVSAVLHPVSKSGMPATHDTNIYFRGAKMTGIMNEDGSIRLTEVTPLELHWVDNTAKSRGHEFAQH